MADDVQVGQDIFPIPDANENAGWGEAVNAWIKAISDVVNDLQGVNDITLTTSAISNNQTAFQSVQGLLFDTGTVKTFTAPYFVVRTVDGTTEVESGSLHGTYNGATWTLLQNDLQQDAGMAFDITAAGQVQYKSDDLSGTNYTGEIKFKAKTLDT